MTPEDKNELPRLLEPCEHMENWVNGLADESLKGPARWYTRFHIRTCSKCRAALAGLKDVHDRLRGLEHALTAEENEAAALTPERRALLEGSLASVEQRKSG